MYAYAEVVRYTEFEKGDNSTIAINILFLPPFLSQKILLEFIGREHGCPL